MVTDLCRRTGLVLLQIGTATPGLLWEIENVPNLVNPTRLVIYLPAFLTPGASGITTRFKEFLDLYRRVFPKPLPADLGDARCHHLRCGVEPDGDRPVESSDPLESRDPERGELGSSSSPSNWGWRTTRSPCSPPSNTSSRITHSPAKPNCPSTCGCTGRSTSCSGRSDRSSAVSHCCSSSGPIRLTGCRAGPPGGSRAPCPTQLHRLRGGPPRRETNGRLRSSPSQGYRSPWRWCSRS